jgi:hypothetical protein
VAAVCQWAVAATRDRDWRTVFDLEQIYGSHLFDYAAEDRFLLG